MTDPRHESFFKIALRNMKHVGGLFPSSKWAAQRVAGFVPESTTVVIEYGPGSGVITRAILKRLPKNGRLIGMELTRDFGQNLVPRGETRFALVRGDVIQLSKSMKSFSETGVDAVVSGIPLSLLNTKDKEDLIYHTQQGLSFRGRFIVYQNTPHVLPLLRKYFTRVRLHFEPRNFLPYFIMVAEK